MSTNILSQDEVDALLHGVDDGAVDTTGDDQLDDGESQVYDFNNQERIVRGHLPTLEMINERFSRYFKVSFFKILRKTPEINLSGIQMIKFSEYINSLFVPTSLSLIKVEPLKGTGMIMMDPRLVFIIVDNFFGGNGSIPARMEGRDLTQTELRVIEKVVKICFVELAKAWQPILDVQFSLYSHEVNPHLANIVGPSEVVVVSSFQIDLEGGGGEIHVVLPYSMIEPIRPILDAGVQSDMSDTDDRWSILLKEELMHAKVELTGLFAEKTLKVSDLINLKSGDIIPIRMPEQVTLMADDMPILRGQYGEHGGKVSIKIENVLVLTDYNDPK